MPPVTTRGVVRAALLADERDASAARPKARRRDAGSLFNGGTSNGQAGFRLQPALAPDGPL